MGKVAKMPNEVDIKNFYYLIIKKVNGVLVESEGQGFEERYVIGHNLLVGKIEAMYNDWIHMVVWQQIIWKKNISIFWKWKYGFLKQHLLLNFTEKIVQSRPSVIRTYQQRIITFEICRQCNRLSFIDSKQM